MKSFVFVILIFLFLLIFPFETKASVVKIRTNGEVVINVLSSEDSIGLKREESELDLERVVSQNQEGSNIVNLVKNDGRIALNVGTKEIDVTDLKEDLVEIEERPKTKKITIRLENGRFLIKQEQVSALTDFAINIDPSQDKLSLSTESGSEFLTVLPFDAAQGILKTRIVTQIAGNLELKKDEGGLFYEVKGNKVIDIFGLYDYKIPVSARISALTGEIRSIESPEWLKVVSFLFV